MEPKPHIGSTGQLVLDVALVLLFIVVAGIFVAAEIALISLRESQLRQLEAVGAKPTRTARLAKLTKNPNRFLAAAQVGGDVLRLPLCSARLRAHRNFLRHSDFGKMGVIPWVEHGDLSSLCNVDDCVCLFGYRRAGAKAVSALSDRTDCTGCRP